MIFSWVNARPPRTGGARLSRIIAVLALAGALVACSAVKTVYSQAPDLAYWYLDGYVDFNGAQSLQVKSGLTRVQAWHRQTQLPAYIDILQKLQERAPSNISATEACDLFAVQWVARKLLNELGDPDEKYQVGDVVQFPTPDGQGQYAGAVQQVGGAADAVQFDFNHPLAGQPVTFEAFVIGVL